MTWIRVCVLVLASLPANGHRAHESAPIFEAVSGEDNKQLRQEALARAEVRATPRQRNPGIASGGLDSAMLRILDQQQMYVASRPDRGTPNQTSKRLTSPYPCSGPMIRAVNGNHTGVIFTPRAPGNVYIIEGCSFGNARGRVQLELGSAVSGHPGSSVALQLENTAGAWSDQEIKARLDTHLSGISDSSVTLAIYPDNGTRMELPGCFFVALRGEPQLLRVIPASWVRLHATRAGSRALEQLEYVSPPVTSNEIPKDAGQSSAFVVRSDSENFGPGSDTYDFSNLAPGWVVHSVQLQTYSIACPSEFTYTQPFGEWNLTWEPRGFTVSWGGNACKAYPAPFLDFSLTFSEYGTKVWVIGPIGTRPVLGFAR